PVVGRPSAEALVDMYTTRVPSWLKLGMIAPSGSPIRCRKPYAFPCAALDASRSNHASCEDLSAPHEVTSTWSPQLQCAFENLGTPKFPSFIAAMDCGVQKFGDAPVIPGTTDPIAPPGVPLSVLNAANCPSGVDV